MLKTPSLGERIKTVRVPSLLNKRRNGKTPEKLFPANSIRLLFISVVQKIAEKHGGFLLHPFIRLDFDIAKLKISILLSPHSVLHLIHIP